MIDEAKQYNGELLRSSVQLTDPFKVKRLDGETVHYNRILNLTELQCLIKDEYKELLESCKAKLTNENEYTFEY